MLCVGPGDIWVKMSGYVLVICWIALSSGPHPHWFYDSAIKWGYVEVMYFPSLSPDRVSFGVDILIGLQLVLPENLLTLVEEL